MIRIVTDSVSSIPVAVARDNGIELVSLSVLHGGDEFVDRADDLDAFYRTLPTLLEDDLPTTTSLPSQPAFEERFERIAEAGDELIGVFMGDELSGTFDCALRAARTVASHHVGFRFRLVNSTTAGLDEGLAVAAAAAGAAAGASLDGCAQLAAEAVASSRIVFSPSSLSYLQRGGRIGSAAALVGNLMKICPVLTVENGTIAVRSKARSHRKALRAVRALMVEEAERFGLADVAVQYIAARDEALTWAHEEIEPVLGRTVPVLPCTAVIGVHVGPAIGVAYRCGKRIPGKVSADPASLVFAS